METTETTEPGSVVFWGEKAGSVVFWFRGFLAAEGRQGFGSVVSEAANENVGLGSVVFCRPKKAKMLGFGSVVFRTMEPQTMEP